MPPVVVGAAVPAVVDGVIDDLLGLGFSEPEAEAEVEGESSVNRTLGEVGDSTVDIGDSTTCDTGS